MISVIVPLRGEGSPRASVLAPLRGPGVELLLAADAGLSPETVAAFEAIGGRAVTLAAPRGARLAAAAREAAGEILLFLHADTVLPREWIEAVQLAVAKGAVGGAFRLAFEGGGVRMAWVAFWANLRTAVTKVPYGDQAPFVRRDVYERLGGHRPWPLLEDLEFGERLRLAGKVVLLSPKVRTSPRRYLERGVARTVLQNWSILRRYRRGESPEDLARLYRA